MKGFLLCELAAMGTKSEGRVYLLQTGDQEEIQIVKKSQTPWQNDKNLDALIAEKVAIQGSISNGKIEYESIKKISMI